LRTCPARQQSRSKWKLKKALRAISKLLKSYFALHSAVAILTKSTN
jgi:hypothetical protein